MNNMIKFLRGNVANLPQTATPGALYFTKDEGVYLGLENGSYHRYGDFITVASVNALPTAGAHETCMYYCVSENILARYDSEKGWIQINKQPTAEEMKTLLGLGSLAYLSEVSEDNLNSALKEKVNAAAEGNHAHLNKGVLDGITAEKVAAWDASEGNAKGYADGLNTAMNTRVEALEAIDHTHGNKELLDTYTQTEANLADAVAKKHSHSFVESELNKIVAGDVQKWNNVVADHLTSVDKAALEDSIGDVNTALETYKTSNNEALASVKATAEAAATKVYTDAELAKKVDKVEGKDLISTSEITRLAGVTNYDDTQVKADIAKKADAETMTTELGKKVDKVEGKSLIADSEIARLLTLSNYDDTQVKADIAKKADSELMTTELGKKVDKVTGYSLVSDEEIARLAEVDNYDDTEVRGLIKDNADAIEVIGKDYLKATDKTELSNAIALKADKSVVEAMYTNGQIDGFLGGKVDKTTYEEEKATFALKSEITSLTGKADKSYVDEELAKKVNISDYDSEKATFALKTDLNVYRTSADQDVIDNGIKGRLETLEAIDHEQLAKDAAASAVATIRDDAPEAFDTLKEIATWISNSETAAEAADIVTRLSTLEAIDHEAYVDADAALKEELEGKINAINNHSHTFVESELNEIKAGDVAKWNGEIGAKALAESKTTTAEVKEQIEAYGYATTGYVDGKASKALEDAIADAAGKYETKGTAQGIVDGLKLSETYEPIGAEGRAIAAAEGKVNALAGTVYTKEQTYTQEEVNALLAQAFVWGEF